MIIGLFIVISGYGSLNAMNKLKYYINHRYVRIAICGLLIILSLFVLSRQMDVVILLFLAANILHIIWDRLWSWVVVGFFLLSYIVVVWRGLIEEYDLLYVKYSFDEFATFCLFGTIITLIILIVGYILKPQKLS